MNFSSQIDSSFAADAAAGVLMLLPFHNKKRFHDEDNNDNELIVTSKKLKSFSTSVSPPMTTHCCPPMTTPYCPPMTTIESADNKGSEKKPIVVVQTSKTVTKPSRKRRDPETQRLTRLEQNRRAAKESRERKSKMIGELQGSVQFFSRANSTLKQQNEELLRLIIEAQESVEADNVNKAATASQSNVPKREEKLSIMSVSEPKIEPKQSPTHAAESMVAVTENAAGLSELLTMQPGSSMQAIATFQQAAAAAMQEALHGLPTSDIVTSSMYQQLPTSTLQSIVLNQHAQQQQYTDALYRDALRTLMMQQAAVANQKQSFLFPGLATNPFMMGPLFALQLQQQQQQQQLQQLLFQQQHRTEKEIIKKEEH